MAQIANRSPVSNVRPAPDQVLLDIADYVLGYRIASEATVATARLCLTDTLAGALDALDFPGCTRLLGPLVPGTVVPHGSRVPGTRYELDPSTAAFSFGAMIRWLDFNDQFSGRQGSHPSDTLAGVLMLGDYLSRSGKATGGKPLLMREILEDLIKAYEIQGCIALENDLEAGGVDHNLLTRVASTAVLARRLSATRDQVVNAVSNAWMDCSPVLYRHAPNTGWRKSWACADASSEAVRLAMMAAKGEMGYPSVLTAPFFGLYDARFNGRRFEFQRPYGEYIINHCMFKFVPAGMHGQSAVECAFLLHPHVKDRIDDIARIDIYTHAYLLDVMHKTGPLYNPADRDHSVQYCAAVGLLHGKLEPRDFEDDFAADPRIDRLREKMVLTAEPRYSREFFDPTVRSSANAMQVRFTDGSSTPKVDVQFPVGHQRRRAEGLPVLRKKFVASLQRRFSEPQQARILEICDAPEALDRMPVNEFCELFIADLPR
ncbi:MAG: 2-methylcitrate dehydratase [Betaproteobacteria bacterium]|jgi:2-methylcitrate dehydratase|nr:2-methylcitrate dehydratase [Betaproteobacteria bacterium]